MRGFRLDMKKAFGDDRVFSSSMPIQLDEDFNVMDGPANHGIPD